MKSQLDELSAKHAKCEQLKEREKKVRRREKKAKDSEDKLQSEKISVELKMKAVEEMKQKFIHFLKKVEFTPSQVEELSQVCTSSTVPGYVLYCILYICMYVRTCSISIVYGVCVNAILYFTFSVYLIRNLVKILRNTSGITLLSVVIALRIKWMVHL